MIRPLFILRTYNDIDHISPLIWKIQNKGAKPIIQFFSSHNIQDDPRLNFLKKNGKIKFISNPDNIEERIVIPLGSSQTFNPFSWVIGKVYYQVRKPNSVLGKFYRRFFFKCNNEINFLKDNKINVLICEWGNPFGRGIKFEKIFIAAKGLGIPVISLPHGLNTLLNSDMHEKYTKQINKGILPNFANWNLYDCVVVQNKWHSEHMIRYGLMREKSKIWGSLRFSNDWFQINKKFSSKFISLRSSEKMVKIVFMLPHWIYNVHKKETYDLIRILIAEKNTYIIIKEHTRGDTGKVSKSFKNEIINNKNVEINDCASSTSIINWSDIVINFGSSIGLEAILQNKILIHPMYLTSNKSIHDEDEVSFTAKSDKDVLNVVNKFRKKTLPQIKKKNIDNLLSKTIYAGKNSKNSIPEYYYKQINQILNFS